MDLRETESGLKTFQHIVLRWLREFIFEDWWLKLIALILALGLWFAVTEQRAPSQIRLRGVKIGFTLPDETELSSAGRDEVEVGLEGDRQGLDRINVRDLIASVDLSKYKPGERVIRLLPENLKMNLPDGVRIKDVHPAQVSVRIEPRTTREVEVRARLEGSPPEGFSVVGVRVTPEKVGVRGPQSRVEALQNASTETISLSDARASFTDSRVAVDTADPNVLASESFVAVRVEIEEQRIEKEIGGVKIYPSAEHRARDEFQLSDVVIYGPRSKVDGASANDFSVLMEKSGEGDSARPRLQPSNESAPGEYELRVVKKQPSR